MFGIGPIELLVFLAIGAVPILLLAASIKILFGKRRD
jgi:hypothetical protein